MTKHGGHPVAVINVDQHASRRRPDLVPDALAELAGVDGLVFQFERTAGDEVQGVCAAPQAVVDVVLRLTRMGGWRIGIGIGAIDEPLPASTRQARGPAYLVAREAIEARRATQSLRLLSALPDQGRGNVGVATYGGFQKAAWYAESALIALRAPMKAPIMTAKPMVRPMIQSTWPEKMKIDSAVMLLTKFMLRATPLAFTRSMG